MAIELSDKTDAILESADGKYMVRLHGRFASRRAAEDAMTAYERAYHPAGYGTRFKELQEVAGLFVVTGTRGRSCD